MLISDLRKATVVINVLQVTCTELLFESPYLPMRPANCPDFIGIVLIFELQNLEKLEHSDFLRKKNILWGTEWVYLIFLLLELVYTIYM